MQNCGICYNFGSERETHARQQAASALLRTFSSSLRYGRQRLDGIHHLRVLIANQRSDRLELLAEVVDGLGHEVIAREIHVSDVAAVTARERPDVALVGLGESAEHALQQISEIVAEAFCPVIALLDTYDGVWVNEAAARGVFAYIVDSRPEELQSAIDITLAPFRRVPAPAGRVRPSERRDAARDGAQAGAAAARARAPRRRRADRWPSPSSRSSSTGATTHVKRCQEALENARAIVSRSLDELRRQGVPLQDLIRDTAPS